MIQHYADMSTILYGNMTESHTYLNEMLQRVGFIGLGNMGYHMASNLITSGYKVTVHDM